MQNDLIKEELEKIEYIKAKTDMSNPLIVLKLYNMLVEKKMLVTEPGVAFLGELREQLLNEPSVDSSRVAPLPDAISEVDFQSVSDSEFLNTEAPAAAEPANDEETGATERQLRKLREYKAEAAVAVRKYEMAQIKIRNYRIVVAFLALLVVLVCVITLATGNSPFVDAEVKVRNEYAAWQEELEAREQRLNELEKSLQEDGVNK